MQTGKLHAMKLGLYKLCKRDGFNPELRVTLRLCRLPLKVIGLSLQCI